MRFPRLGSLSLLALLATCPACDKPQPSPPAPAPVTVDAASAPAPAQAAPSAASDERAARELLDQWLLAQNSGDFAGYERLYAARSYGEKRAGSRLSKFDRAGWLADRKRMFERPMKVAIAELQIKSSAGGTLLTFEQTFSQASFQDRGPKRMTLVRENGALRIASELMLASTLTAGDPRVAEDFYFVVHVQGRAYAVLKSGAPRAWGSGAPSAPVIEDDGTTYVVFQGVRDEPQVAAYAGRALRVYSRAGSSCEARVGALSLMAAVVPHFATAQAFRGERDLDKVEAPWPPARVAASILSDVWDDDLALVGELRGCDGDFATSPARKLKVLARVMQDVPDSAADEAVARLPLYKRAQAEYLKAMREEGVVDPGSWPEAVERARFGGGDDSVVSIRMTRGNGCGDYTESLSALFRPNADKLSPLASARPGPAAPYLLLDLDSDGVLSLLSGASEFNRTLTRITGNTSNELKRVPFSFQDCGC